MLAAPALIVLVQFALLAASKPGEYGRFFLLPDVALAISAVLSMAILIRPRSVFVPLLVLLLVLQGYHAGRYLLGFLADAQSFNSRTMTAGWLDSVVSPTNDRLWIDAEPAPYVMPPVNVFRWKLILPPPGQELQDDQWTASIRTLPWRQNTPISWANIFFETALNPAPPLTAQR